MQRSVDMASETVQGSRSVFTPPDRDQSILHALIGGEMDQETCPGKGQAQGLWDTLLSSNAAVRLADYSTFFGGWQKTSFHLHYIQQECQIVSIGQDRWNLVACK